MRRGRSDSCCWCYGGSASSGGDAELEARILEFMGNSRKPGAFPTRRELEEAGRYDLAEAIGRRGGWFSLGWDLDDDMNERLDIDLNMEEFLRRVNNCRDSGAFEGNEAYSLDSHGSSESASSSGRSLKIGAEEESGIEGILQRLEKHRQSSLHICSEKSENGKWASSRGDGNDMKIVTTDAVRCNLGDTSMAATDSWRTWSTRRAGFHDTEFEPAEISFGQDKEGRKTSMDETAVVTEKGTENLFRQSGVYHNDIRARIQHFEAELNSALEFMMFKSSQKVMRGSCSRSDVLKLSDALEFQENQFINAQERLRSIRTKLTILEGKMTLATIDAQKTTEKKQSRIDSAYIAMRLLRTTHIVWPNSASEVLVAGSFDSWTCQRKMEKSSAGIFSLTLLLYPGKYEIKFIVDGKWRVDPLRPVVQNHGHENNLLVII
ncbi:unnamed protein product [Cuscuta campestris]|uniref:AMP-activated protein kinase glycogen-binding domain-containing protein n=1 Tax=Cuscuta campestris TaxID=132261 RepID=A0A484KL84_9ASTE|nr:unnamed protein product [Cuscuta campestris]